VNRFSSGIRVGAVACAALMQVVAMGGLAHAATSQVTFRTSSGRAVTALLVEAAQGPAPAVVLVPMLGRPKEDWEATAERFAAANITALAIDLPATAVPGDGKALAAWSEGITAALAFLAQRPDVRADALGIAGASLGASLAAVAAAADRNVRAIALISPSLDYRGVRIEPAMRDYGSRPALLIASRQDPYAARSARDLAKNPPGVRELQWSDLGAHGTALLSREPELVQALVEWFRRTLA
jgi:dienelactone hydrolase